MFNCVTHCGCCNNVVNPNRSSIPGIKQVNGNLSVCNCVGNHAIIQHYLCPAFAARKVNAIDLHGSSAIVLVPEAQGSVSLQELDLLCCQVDIDSCSSVCAVFLEPDCLAATMCICYDLKCLGLIVNPIAGIYTVQHQDLAQITAGLECIVAVQRHVLQAVYQHITGVVDGNNSSVAFSNCGLLDCAGEFKASNLSSFSSSSAANLSLNEFALQQNIAVLVFNCVTHCGCYNNIVKHYLMIQETSTVQLNIDYATLGGSSQHIAGHRNLIPSIFQIGYILFGNVISVYSDCSAVLPKRESQICIVFQCCYLLISQSNAKLGNLIRTGLMEQDNLTASFIVSFNGDAVSENAEIVASILTLQVENFSHIAFAIILDGIVCFGFFGHVF